MESKTPRYAWMNKKCVPWEQATLHVRTQAVFFGSNVFEGIRAYWSEERKQLNVFKLDEHLRRMEAGMKIMRMKPPMSRAELAAGVIDVLRANEYRQNAHMIVATYFGHSEDFDPLFPTEDTGAYITALPFDRAAAAIPGFKICVSSWRRISDDSVPPRIKVGANYQNGRLAQHDARANGYHTAVLLNNRGKVAETPGTNLLLVKDGQLISPSATSDILEGVTLQTLKDLARTELKIPVVERDVDRTELYLADEVIICGTIAEVVPVVSIDKLEIGDGTAGAITQKLRDLYFKVVTGADERYASLLTPVWV